MTTPNQALNSPAQPTEGAGQQQQQGAADAAKADITAQTQVEGDPKPPVAKALGVKDGEAEIKTDVVDPNKKAEDEVKGAPEAYEDFKFGENVEVGADFVADFKTVAKELNLSQADAQKIAAFAGKYSDKMAENHSTVNDKIIEKAKGEWEKQTKADKEIGGEKFTENLAVAKKALNEFATPEFITLLNKSGLGSNPEVIRTFFRIGKMVSEDNVLVSGKHAPSQETAANKLYGATSNKS